MHRYSIYLVLVGSFLISLNTIKIKPNHIIAFFLLSALFLVQIFIVGDGLEQGYFFARDAFFMLLPIGVIMVLKEAIRDYKKTIDIILWSIIILGLLIFVKKISSLGSFNFVSILISSKSVFETPTAPFYALAGLTAVICKKRIPFLILSFFCILASKRIVTLSYLVVLIFYFFNLLGFTKKKKYRIVFALFVLAVNGLIILFMYRLGAGYFDDIIFEYTQLPTQTFTAGRSQIYKYLFLLTPLKTLYIGNGIGYAPYLMQVKLQYIGLDLLHSDILRLFVELGVIAFSILIYTLYAKAKGKIVYLLMLFNIFLLTDNYLIYAEIMFFTYLCALLIIDQEKKANV